MDDKDNADLLAVLTRIDTATSDLRREESAIRAYNQSLADRIALLLTETNGSLITGLRLSLASQAEALKNLTGFCKRLESARSDYLSEYLKKAIPRLHRKLLSPFWLGSQASNLSELSGLQESLKSLTGSDRGEDERWNEVSSVFERFDLLLKGVEQEKQVARKRAPLKTLLWALPIYVGVVIGIRPGLRENIALLIVMLVLTAGSFIFASRKTFRADRDSALRTFLTSEGAQAVYGLLIFGGIIAGFVVAVQKADPASYPPTVLLSQTEMTVHPGEVVIPQIGIALSKPSVEVRRVVGILTSPILRYPMRSAEIDSLSMSPSPLEIRITIPSDIPIGRYPVELKTDYELGTTLPLFGTRYEKKTLTSNFILVVVP